MSTEAPWWLVWINNNENNKSLILNYNDYGISVARFLFFANFFITYYWNYFLEANVMDMAEYDFQFYEIKTFRHVRKCVLF